MRSPRRHAVKIIVFNFHTSTRCENQGFWWEAAFFFVSWFDLFFWNFLWFHEHCCMKTWNPSCFCEKIKKYWTPFGACTGPEGRSGGQSWGPRAQWRHHMGFYILLNFRISWIPPKVFKFSCRIFVNTNKNDQ